MSAYLEITNGEARFAYNGINGDPWHRLGTDVEGYGTLDEMLVAAKANWTVDFAPLFTMLDGTAVELTDKVATVRDEIVLDADGFRTDRTNLGVVGRGSYTIEQNRTAAEWGMELVGASNGDAVIDTMGVLFDGKEFFLGIDMGTLVLDPDGISDVIKRYLVVRNRHDGGASLMAYPTNTRVVCWNTATMSLEGAKKAGQVHRIRHTQSKDDRKADAIEAMGLARKLGELFANQAMVMLGTRGGSDVLTDVVSSVWAKPAPDATDRVRTNWQDRRTEIQRIYESDTCEAAFGSSGWTVWNAVTQYLDHSRPRTTERKRALATADLDGSIAKAKDKAAQRVLQLAGV